MDAARRPSKLHDQPFRFYVREHPRAFTLGVISLFFTNLLDVLSPLGLKAGIDAVTSHDQPGLFKAIGLFVALMAGVTYFRYLWRIYFGRFHHSVADDLRNRIFTKLTELGPSFYQRTPTGQLMSLLTNDVNSFRMAIGPGLLILLDATFLIAMILPVMITLSWSWTWKTLILLPAVPFIIRNLEAKIHDRFRIQQDRLSDVTGRTQEIVSGVRVIKSFAQEENQTKSFNLLSKDYENACNQVAKVDSSFQPAMEASVTFGSVILLYFCSPAVMRNEITLGTLVAFHEYIKRMVWPMSAIGSGISMLEQGRASFDRIRELFTTQTDIPDEGDFEIDTFRSLEIEHVTFRYPNAMTNALNDVSLTIRSGETIGIVGPVGAGKTTLLQLISRLYPLHDGTIRVNGVELTKIKRSSLSKTFSYVTQDAFLFSDTIAENVALGLPLFPGLEPVQEATAHVNIDAEIHTIPGRYDAYLGERGVNLSGGQKQRLTIARALIRRSPVVILDDSLSAVDGKTEKAITSELRRQLGQDASVQHARPTVILVSHRLATLLHADRIVVLDQGRIEAVGSHTQLLHTSPTYRHLNDLQSAPLSEVSL